jgi:hypothetical protein
MSKQTGSKEYNNFRLNMPETIENMFNVLFNDESWTWQGLAYILVKRFSKGDLEDFNTIIEIELKEKYKND